MNNIRSATRSGFTIARLREDRGAVAALLAIAMVALLGIAALVVDMGIMLTARTESQRVADLSALAGAGAFVVSPGNGALARSLATTYAAQNTVRSQTVALQPADIQVYPDSNQVRVTVYNVLARSNAIPTVFARVLGINTVDIVTTAVAEASPATGLNCILPLALPDRWQENGGDPEFYDAGIDSYIPWDPSNPGAAYTGYSDADIGTQVIIKPNQGGGPANESWYYPWRPPGQQGGADYRANINSCVDPTIAYFVGQIVPTEPGAMIGPTKQGFTDLINQDPTATWNDNVGMKCVVDQTNLMSSDPADCRGSPRVRPMPMFDPTQAPDPGVKPFTFTNFAAVFVDHIQGNDIHAVFLGYGGVSPSGGGSTSAGPLFKVLRLIE